MSLLHEVTAPSTSTRLATRATERALEDVPWTMCLAPREQRPAPSVRTQCQATSAQDFFRVVGGMGDQQAVLIGQAQLWYDWDTTGWVRASAAWLRGDLATVETGIDAWMNVRTTPSREPDLTAPKKEEEYSDLNPPKEISSDLLLEIIQEFEDWKRHNVRLTDWVTGSADIWLQLNQHGLELEHKFATGQHLWWAERGLTEIQNLGE